MDLDKTLKNKFIFPFSLIVTMIGNITFNFLPICISLKKLKNV
ncbi:hypothetical protein [Fusobacterium sp. FSA-380-WT-2B]|nr:hypothetical protein [Fusobacterium sp. FSA-380-WT-2B]